MSSRSNRRSMTGRSVPAPSSAAAICTCRLGWSGSGKWTRWAPRARVVIARRRFWTLGGRRHRSCRWYRQELGVRPHAAVVEPEDPVADLEVAHVRPDTVDDTSEVGAQDPLPWSPQTVGRPCRRLRYRSADTGTGAVDGRRRHPDEQLRVTGLRHRDVAQLDHVGSAVGRAQRCSHQRSVSARRHQGRRPPTADAAARGDACAARRLAPGRSAAYGPAIDDGSALAPVAP